MKPVYYNDNDSHCVAWLRNLINAGHLPQGEVDDRPIQSVTADDLGRFGQCHFFAGIGGWALALRLAGWPDDQDIWTGSCPCQPFSAAGKRQGTADARHLWPEFFRLIAQCHPAVVAGEQVASKDGRLWLAGVRADLEALGYAVGSSDLCAAGIAAPHIRQRLYWVADSDGWVESNNEVQRGGQQRQQPAHDAHFERLGDAAGKSVCGSGQPWEPAITIECADGFRRIGPDPLALAHGIPNRMGRLRGYGNAIVPQVAAQFVAAYMECRPVLPQGVVA